MEATLRVNDLSHSYISARCYAISGPLLWYIGPAASDVSGLIYRVSTNVTEQISRRFPGDSRKDFKKNP